MVTQKFIGEHSLCFVFAVLSAWISMGSSCSPVPTGRSPGSTENGLGEPVCPICLDHPVAPRTARCGHVFCWPCCSHLLSISDTSSITLCPVCFQLLESDSLRRLESLFCITFYHKSSTGRT
uniref:E3 ubiquitin-protein ligase RNF10 n=1 Tax=Eptatretus burgeri TaxID=7764 RepID=A0A8C4QW72_EPTBU